MAAKGRKIGRNARTGRFTPVSTARRKKGTHVVETIPKRGRKKSA
jgi:hypothetical protein